MIKNIKTFFIMTLVCLNIQAMHQDIENGIEPETNLLTDTNHASRTYEELEAAHEAGIVIQYLEKYSEEEQKLKDSIIHSRITASDNVGVALILSMFIGTTTNFLGAFSYPKTCTPTGDIHNPVICSWNGRIW